MKIGVALGGGGVRGAAHLGILQALEEVGIQPHIYGGTSAGSIVAAMKSLGYTNEEILSIMQGVDSSLIDIAYWSIFKSLPFKLSTLDSVLKGKKLRAFFEEATRDRCFEETVFPLSIISTDLNSGSQVILTNNKIENPQHVDDYIKVIDKDIPSISDSIYASCALPGIFPSVQYKGMRLVDGSLTNNLPANVVKEMGADKVIAIDVSTRDPKTKVEGFYNILSHSISVLVEQNTDLSLSYVEDAIYISPEMDASILEFNRVDDCYITGYEYGKTIAHKIKELLK